MKAIYFLTTALLLTIGSWATAQETVTCINGDCLVYGYEKADSQNMLFEIGECSGLDCDLYGWVVYRLSGFTTSIICADSSCYGKGFQEIDTATNTLLRTRTCVDNGAGGDCIANGWRDEFPDSSIERTRPTDGISTENGFIVEKIVDQSLTYQQQIAEIKSTIEDKKDQLKDYLRAHRRINKDLVKEIVDLGLQLIKLKRELKTSGGIVVVEQKEAVCLAPGACYTQGYVIQ